MYFVSHPELGIAVVTEKGDPGYGRPLTPLSILKRPDYVIGQPYDREEPDDYPYKRIAELLNGT